MIIWGNHSSTQYPDVSHGVFERDGASTPILSAVDADWVRGDFITTVQKRGAAIIEARKLSSAASAAKAITGTPCGVFVAGPGELARVQNPRKKWNGCVELPSDAT